MLGRAIAYLVAGSVSVASGCREPSEDNPAPAPHETSDAVAKMLARADELERGGDLQGALEQARTAIEAGGGRDATVATAKLAIALERYDEAIGLLEPLVATAPDDAIAQYDLGLAHHQRNDYNGARRGYLAALRADPSLADARYNLALLCWKRGIHEEGRHHVGAFLEAFPQDPRGRELEAMIGVASPTPQGTATPSPPPG